MIFLLRSSSSSNGATVATDHPETRRFVWKQLRSIWRISTPQHPLLPKDLKKKALIKIQVASIVGSSIQSLQNLPVLEVHLKLKRVQHNIGKRLFCGNMDGIEVQACCMMYMCCFFLLNVMMTVCAIRQHNNRNSIVEYEIESTSVKRRKQYEHLHREPIDSPSLMASDNSASETSRRRKRKAHARDPTMETIYTNFRQFVEMVGPVFKMMSETAALKEAARKEIEEKKKLLGQVIFEIDGLSEDEAMFILQVLVKDEDQLKTFFDLPDDKKLCFCRAFLARMSYRRPSI